MLWKGLLIFARQAFVAPPSKIAFLNSDKVTQLVLSDCGLPASKLTVGFIYTFWYSLLSTGSILELRL